MHEQLVPTIVMIGWSCLSCYCSGGSRGFQVVSGTPLHAWKYLQESCILTKLLLVWKPPFIFWMKNDIHRENDRELQTYQVARVGNLPVSQSDHVLHYYEYCILTLKNSPGKHSTINTTRNTQTTTYDDIRLLLSFQNQRAWSTVTGLILCSTQWGGDQGLLQANRGHHTTNPIRHWPLSQLQLFGLWSGNQTATIE